MASDHILGDLKQQRFPLSRFWRQKSETEVFAELWPWFCWSLAIWRFRETQLLAAFPLTSGSAFVFTLSPPFLIQTAVVGFRTHPKARMILLNLLTLNAETLIPNSYTHSSERTCLGRTHNSADYSEKQWEASNEVLLVLSTLVLSTIVQSTIT